MKNNTFIRISSQAFIVLCILSLGYVSILSLISPQATMDLVQVRLPNNDALSSIRGIYGGVGLVIIASLIYLFFDNVKKALLFMSAFWGAYALSRLITLLADGPLGDFGSQWLMIESVFCLIAIALCVMQPKQTALKMK